jgi:5-methylcytosine-specific restriction endonuclease McrA
MSETGYREKAIVEYGEECQNCGETEGILVHHRDGDRTNNDLSNLIPLCSACHGKVHGRSKEVPQLVRELGYRPRSPERTTVNASETLMQVLHERKSRGESYEDVIWSLIGQTENK